MSTPSSRLFTGTYQLEDLLACKRMVETKQFVYAPALPWQPLLPALVPLTIQPQAEYLETSDLKGFKAGKRSVAPYLDPEIC